MRYEDREIADLESDHDVVDERTTDLEREDERKLPVGEQHEGFDDLVMGTIGAILDRQTIVVNDLALPKREREALEALKTAVDGKDPQLARFVYAEDRERMLDAALAVLQPHLAPHTTQIEQLANRVAELREQLRHLDESEDDEELYETGEEHAAAPAPKDDKGDKGDKGDDADADRPTKSTLADGPEVKDTVAKSTLADGPEVKEAPYRSALADGPEVKDAPQKSALADGGPAAPEVAPAPTTLGDAAEIDAAAKRPWWKIWQKP